MLIFLLLFSHIYFHYIVKKSMTYKEKTTNITNINIYINNIHSNSLISNIKYVFIHLNSLFCLKINKS